MNRQHDLELVIRSRTPIVIIETRNESRMLDLLKRISRSRDKDATDHILGEVAKTQQSSVVMAHKIGLLRDWAHGRTVACD